MNTPPNALVTGFARIDGSPAKAGAEDLAGSSCNGSMSKHCRLFQLGDRGSSR